MAEHIIEVRVDEKIASVVGDPLYVCGNSDYIVKFHFDAEWAGHETKTARFIKSNKEYIDVLFSGNQCAVPIIDNTPYVRIGVYAGNLCTTTAAIVNAQRSILCGSGVPADPDPDIYSQMMARFDELFQRDVKTDSEKLGGLPASDYALKSATTPATIVQKELKVASEAELENALTAELNTMWNNSVRFLVISPTSSALFSGIGMLCELYMRSISGYATATFTGYGLYTTEIMYKTMWAGAWHPLEYANPPMVLGVEYRTTERWQGKAVYTKLVDFGVLPEASEKSVSHGAAATNIIEITGTLSNGNKATSGGDYIDGILGRKTDIWVHTSAATARYYSAVFKIKYTKD